jgi:hypothetical protein
MLSSGASSTEAILEEEHVEDNNDTPVAFLLFAVVVAFARARTPNSVSSSAPSVITIACFRFPDTVDWLFLVPSLLEAVCVGRAVCVEFEVLSTGLGVGERR